jgi:hypothetical protein
MSAAARRHLGLDANNAHTQPGGGYHYHGPSAGLLAALGLGDETPGKMALIGFAADGFPIYWRWAHRDPQDPASPLVEMRPGYALRQGLRQGGPGGRFDGTFVEDYAYRPAQGALDAANGRFGVTPEWPGGTYHYVATRDFPWLPRFFRGAPHPSFASHGDGPGIDGVPPKLRDYMGTA